MYKYIQLAVAAFGLVSMPAIYRVRGWCGVAVAACAVLWCLGVYYLETRKNSLHHYQKYEDV